MRYLGLDLGTKTLGIAISDKTNMLASFLKVIRFTNQDYESLIPELKKIIDENNITELALGLPKNMDNSLGFASERSLNFKEIIEKNINIKVNLIDERLTTVEAENILISMDRTRKKRKKVIDGLAACIILESFLKERENKNDNK